MVVVTESCISVLAIKLVFTCKGRRFYIRPELLRSRRIRAKFLFKLISSSSLIFLYLLKYLLTLVKAVIDI